MVFAAFFVFFRRPRCHDHRFRRHRCHRRRGGSPQRPPPPKKIASSFFFFSAGGSFRGASQECFWCSVSINQIVKSSPKFCDPLTASLKSCLRRGHAAASRRCRSGIAAATSRRRCGVAAAVPRRRRGVAAASPLRRRRDAVTTPSRFPYPTFLVANISEPLFVFGSCRIVFGRDRFLTVFGRF